MKDDTTSRLIDRVPHLARVTVWRGREGVPAHVRALSADSVRLRGVDLELGAYATLSIALPSSERFTALCKVVGVDDDVSLELVDVAPRHRARIAATVGAELAPARVAA